MGERVGRGERRKVVACSGNKTAKEGWRKVGVPGAERRAEMSEQTSLVLMSKAAKKRLRIGNSMKLEVAGEVETSRRKESNAGSQMEFSAEAMALSRERISGEERAKREAGSLSVSRQISLVREAIVEA